MISIKRIIQRLAFAMYIKTHRNEIMEQAKTLRRRAGYYTSQAGAYDRDQPYMAGALDGRAQICMEWSNHMMDILEMGSTTCTMRTSIMPPITETKQTEHKK